MVLRKVYRLLAVLILLALLASCGGSAPAATTTAATTAAQTTAAAAETQTTTAAATESQQELIEIEFMNMDQSWTPVIFGDDPVTKVFMEKTGVNLICSAPQGPADQIANVMLSSGDYPEMMHMSVNATYSKYIAAGALYPIDELAKQYNHPNLINGNYIYDDVIRIRTEDDGHFYLAPNWFSEDGFGATGLCVNVRNDIYTQLGSPEIETVEDLMDYFAEIKALNMTTPDGLKVWPFNYDHNDSNNIGYIANWWGSQIRRFMYYNEDEQKIEFFLRNPNTLEAIKFLSKCLAEGYLDPETLTFDSTQRTEAWTTGKYGVVVCHCWSLWWNIKAALTAVDPEMYYVTILPPAGTPGVYPYFGSYTTTGGSGTMITKNCKNVEAAIGFIDFFMSPEGETLNFYGTEGDSMYFDEAGKPWLYDYAYEYKLNDSRGGALKYGIRIFDMMNDQKYNWERTQESEDRKRNRELANINTFDGSLIVAIMIDPETDEGVLLAEIEANIRSELTAMIMESDPAKIESMMADTLAEYERRGIAKFEEYATEAYNKKK